MKAVGLTKATGGVELFEEFEIPTPELGPKDILVKLEATGMNPIDAMLRGGMGNPGPIEKPTILGHDGVGIVEKVGSEASLFKVGDRVWMAGSLLANGTDAEYIAVDERIVGLAPKSIPDAKAAAIPLVLLTAWEGLFESLGIKPMDPANAGKTLLILPGAGGVGSFVIQLAKKLCGLTVIATGSRPESVAACKTLGADIVINHREPLKPQLEAEGISGVDYIYNAYRLEAYFDQYVDLINPMGKILSIMASSKDLNFTPLFMKRVTFVFEFMFSRPMFGTDPIQQHHILNNAASLVDSGLLKLPDVEVNKFSLENLKKAHEKQESGKMIGKQVLCMKME